MSEAPIYRFDGIVVDPGSFRATRDGAEAPLEPKAFRVLLHLIENRDRAVSKDELLSTVWKGTFVSDHVLTRAIAQIRKSLGDNSKQARYIETVPTVGYRFAAMLETATSEKPQPVTARRRWRWIWIAAGGAAVAAGVLVTRSPSVFGVNSLPPVIQITTSDGLEAWPAISPDGGFLAYASDKNGAFEIYIRSLDGRTPERRLTSGGQNIQPAWSPDGQRIAYYSTRDRGIFAIPSVGGAPQRLTSLGSQPAWSPDGRTIAFTSEQPYSMAAVDFLPVTESAIWSVSADGGEATPLTKPQQPPGRHARPKWSPTGEIYFISHRGFEGSSLHRMRADGSALRRVAGGEQIYLDLAIHPAGRQIYYSTLAPDKAFSLWRMRLDAAGDAVPGSLSQVVHYAAEQPRELSISPDGGRLALGLSRATSNLWSTPVGGGKLTPLTSDTNVRNTHPRFSPDGSRIAWFVNRSGAGGDIWIMNRDGSNPSSIAPSAPPNTQPQWTPDGRGIVYGLTQQGVQRLWVKHISGGGSFYGKGTVFANVPRWSRDGRLGVFQKREAGTGRMRIYRSAAAGGEPVALTPTTQSIGFPVLSHDSRWVASELFRDGRTIAAVIPASGGDPALLESATQHDWVYDWSPDSKEISAATFDGNGWRITAIAWPSGQRRAVTERLDARQFVRYPAWSPDGRTIVFERHESRGNVYLLQLK